MNGAKGRRRLAAIALGGLLLGVAPAACGGSDEAGSGAETEAGSPAAAEGEASAPRGEAPRREDGRRGEGGRASVETIVLRDGEPVGGVAELSYEAGERVRFRVRSDVADEVHVHGYDLTEEVGAGGSASFSFPADIEGIFEVELEERGEQIAELRVSP